MLGARLSLLGAGLGSLPPALLCRCPQTQVQLGDTWRAGGQAGCPCAVSRSLKGHGPAQISEASQLDGSACLPPIPGASLGTWPGPVLCLSLPQLGSWGLRPVQRLLRGRPAGAARALRGGPGPRPADAAPRPVQGAGPEASGGGTLQFPALPPQVSTEGQIPLPGLGPALSPAASG